ncbi:MAG TPA: hypothetical protein VIF88_03895 [Methylocystis sp.]|jgi:hypothetical protein
MKAMADDEMRVARADDGMWMVTSAAGVVLAAGMSNAEAWRWVDRASREPASRHEKMMDAFFAKTAGRL